MQDDSDFGESVILPTTYQGTAVFSDSGGYDGTGTIEDDEGYLFQDGTFFAFQNDIRYNFNGSI